MKKVSASVKPLAMLHFFSHMTKQVSHGQPSKNKNDNMEIASFDNISPVSFIEMIPICKTMKNVKIGQYRC